MLRIQKLLLAGFLFLIPLHAFAQHLDAYLEEDLKIGQSESGPQEYFLSLPTQVCVDKQGNIYVADYYLSKIRVFDSTGTYMTSIGRKGKGPGEMMAVTSMCIDHHNNLVVTDQFTLRITRFINNGKYVKTYPFPVKGYYQPWIILPAKGAFLLYYSPPTKSISEIEDSPVLHFWDESFKKVIASIARKSSIWNINDPFLRIQAGGPFSAFIDVDTIRNRIALVPHYYDGVIHLFENRYEKWIHKELQGLKPRFRPFVLLNRKDYKNRSEWPKPWQVISFMNSSFITHGNNISIGIAFLDDGSLVHFTSLKDTKKGYILGVELFDPKGRFIGYGRLKNFLPLPPDKAVALRLAAKDGQDRLYFVDLRDMDIPVIRRMKLHFSVKNR